MLNFVLFFAAVIIAVILGTKTKVNMGFWAYLFAFFLGFFRAGKTISGVIGLFPIATYYALLTSALFFGYAVNNGTMQVFTQKLMWRFRRQAWMAPLIMFIIGSIVSLSGVNGSTGLVLSSMCYAVAASVGCDPLPVLMAVGAAAGGWGQFPWCSAGAVNFSVLEPMYGQDIGYFSIQTAGIFVIIISFITIIYVCIRTKAFKKKESSAMIMQEPPAYSKEQKITLTAMMTALALIVIPTLLNAVFKTAFTKTLSSIFSVQVVWTVGIVVLALLNIGDLKTLIVNRVSWNAVILVTGMCTLFGLAQPLGVVDVFTEMLNHIPSWCIVPAIAAIGGVLSFFVNGLVLTPMFAPLAESFAAASGHSVELVLVAFIAGAIVASISPISAGGAYLLSAAPDDETASKAYNGLFKYGCINIVVATIVFAIVQNFGW